MLCARNESAINVSDSLKAALENTRTLSPHSPSLPRTVPGSIGSDSRGLNSHIDR